MNTTTNTSNIEKKKDDLIKLCKDIIKDNIEDDRYCNFSTFINELKKKKNDFSPRLYGGQTSRPSTFFMNLKKDNKKIFTFDLKNKQLFISVNTEK